MLNAMLWMARSGASWEDLPERHGPWKLVYGRLYSMEFIYEMEALDMRINFNIPQMHFASMGRVSQFAKQQDIADSLTKQFDSKTIAENLERSRRMDSATLVHDTSWQKIVPVSDEVKQELADLVKSDFTERGGMSGENSRYTAIVSKYVHALPKSERPAALFTLSEAFTNEAGRVRDFIKSKDPSWNFGKPVKPEILKEAFRAPADSTHRLHVAV